MRRVALQGAGHESESERCCAYNEILRHEGTCTKKATHRKIGPNFPNRQSGDSFQELPQVAIQICHSQLAIMDVHLCSPMFTLNSGYDQWRAAWCGRGSQVSASEKLEVQRAEVDENPIFKWLCNPTW